MSFILKVKNIIKEEDKQHTKATDEKNQITVSSEIAELDIPIRDAMSIPNKTMYNTLIY